MRLTKTVPYLERDRMRGKREKNVGGKPIGKKIIVSKRADSKIVCIAEIKSFKVDIHVEL